MGWLHAIPEETLENGKVQRWKHDRLTQLRAEGRTDLVPELGPGRYLFDALILMRPIRPLAMGGIVPVSWQEIEAFARATGDVTESWEKKLLMRMSKAYLDGHIEGKDVLSIAPIDRDEEDDG